MQFLRGAYAGIFTAAEPLPSCIPAAAFRIGIAPRSSVGLVMVVVRVQEVMRCWLGLMRVAGSAAGCQFSNWCWWQ